MGHCLLACPAMSRLCNALCMAFLILAAFRVQPANSFMEPDPNGYITFCPCMGRFGNQADHFLGVLSFAQGLNRTLVLPPWVEYHSGKRNSVQIPFDVYFRESGVNQYHRVVTMEIFMNEVAPQIWPPEERIVWCYSARRGDQENSCNAKEGNPFGPFWDTFEIDFVKSEFYGPMTYDTRSSSAAHQWSKKYPASKYPVLAFAGAPAAFPIQEHNVHLHKYLKWSSLIDNEADSFIENVIQQRPFLGIHLRNGIDWKRACEHVQEDQVQNLFGSWQCLGHTLAHGRLSKEMCYPAHDTILSQVKREVKRIKAKVVFVAADSDFMIDKIQNHLKKMQTKVVRHEPSEPHVDLAILAKADHYIGNCVSTFSSFATRERLVNGKSSSFWAFTAKRHDEL